MKAGAFAAIFVIAILSICSLNSSGAPLPSSSQTSTPALKNFVEASALTNSSSANQTQLVRMSVTTNKYSYSETDALTATITIQSLEYNNLTNVSIANSIYNLNNSLIQNLPSVPSFELGSFQKLTFNVTASINLDDANYALVSDAIGNLSEQIGSANVPLVVLSTAGRAPLTLAFVFHMHQPIYLNLQGQFEQPWVQVHTGSDFEYNGTSYGAYYWYIYMLEQHPNISVTFNLQPTLLYQWNYSLSNFQYNSTYTPFPGGEAAMQHDLATIGPTIAGYKSLAASGRVEILTSPFYHPLSALLVQLGLSQDLKTQISLGKNYTEKMMGITPEGMFTPEMGFTMPMVPIIESEGLNYTILDQANEFVGATGSGASQSIYQPFLLDGANGSHIIVFFRDTGISTNMFYSFAQQSNPQVAASDFVAAAANVYRNNPGGVLTVALDGENPIVEGDELISALDYFQIFSAIETQSSWLVTSTLSHIVATRSVTSVLTSVPNGSWSGGFGLWIGAPQKTAIWQSILQSRKILVNLTNTYGMNNPEIQKLWNYLYIAEGSDWEWQTPGGPAWFAMQGYRYAHAATIYSPETPSTPSASPNYEVWGIIIVAVVAAAAGVGFIAIKRRKKTSPQSINPDTLP